MKAEVILPLVAMILQAGVLLRQGDMLHRQNDLISGTLGDSNQAARTRRRALSTNPEAHRRAAGTRSKADKARHRARKALRRKGAANEIERTPTT